MPQHPVMLALLKAIGRPLRVTSANRSGSPAPKTFAEAMMDLANVVDMGLEDEPAPLGISSTVVQVDVKNRIKIIRAGALSATDLNNALATIQTT